MAEPGWYDDPADATRIAYWDGVAWSGHTQPRPGVAPAPPVSPATAAAPPAAPASIWGPPGTERARANWGPSPALPPNLGVRVEERRRRRRGPWAFLLLLVLLLAAGVAGLLYAVQPKEEPVADAPVAVTEVLAALATQNVTCSPDPVELTPDEAADAAAGMPARYTTASGAMTQRQAANLVSASSEVATIARDLPTGAYALPQCGNSWVLRDDVTAYVVVLGPDARGAEAQLRQLGVPVRVL